MMKYKLSMRYILIKKKKMKQTITLQTMITTLLHKTNNDITSDILQA